MLQNKKENIEIRAIIKFMKEPPLAGTGEFNPADNTAPFLRQQKLRTVAHSD